MADILAKGITWNLSDLYPGPDSAELASDLRLAEEKAVEFEKKYKGYFEQTGKATSLPLARLLADYKEIVVLVTRLGVFASLSFSEKTNEPARGAFMQKIQVALTDIDAHLVFFGVHWNKLDGATAEKLMSLPEVREERHFLEKSRIYAPHTLSEPEEKIMAAKSNTSGSAFSRLFDEIMNNVPFYIEEGGRRVKKNESELLALFHSEDRSARKSASDALAEGLKENTHILTYIYNMILADHRTSLKIRNYKHPMDGRNLSNEIGLDSVMNLIASVKRAYPIAQRYYRLKKKLLGLDTFHEYDRYAPLGKGLSDIPFERCREIVLGGYYDFSEKAGRIVEQFFTKRWIDAEVREGKRGGGFCCSTIPGLHPYILVNYTGGTEDVMTVAHELGHGLHQYTAMERVGILEADAPLILAETASVFGEMLIFEKLMQSEKDPSERLKRLCGYIDGNFSTIYRQIAMTEFELLAHDAGLKEGELPAEKLSDFWMRTNAEFYGDSVQLTDNYRHSWKYIPHFVHSPFYCYAYSFAQLFVLSLFQKYKQDPAGFVPLYLEMLSLGGSRKPQEIAAIAGLDIQHPDFWKGGLKLLDDLVRQAEELAR